MTYKEVNGKRIYSINIALLEETIAESTPNEEQKEVIKGLTEWYRNWDSSDNEHEPSVLAAFGGCGKSYVFSLVVLNIVKELYYKGFIQYQDQFEVTLLAPSNAASQVMRDFSQRMMLWKFCKVRCTTVHSFSGVVLGELDHKAERITNDIFEDDEGKKEQQTRFNLVIVDEYGMIPDDLYYKKLANFHEMPILYLGNLEQLPPVNSMGRKPGSSIIDELHSMNYFTLSEVMRNTGSILSFSNQLLQQYPIAGLEYSKLVEKLLDKGLDSRFNTSITPPATNVLLPFESDDQVVVLRRYDLLRELSETGLISSSLLEKDYSHFKVLCYSNAAVNEWNTLIRKMLFGEASSMIHKNETFLVKAPVYEYVNGGAFKLFFTNQRIKLDEVKLIQYPLIDRVTVKKCCVNFPGTELEFYQFTALSQYGEEKDFLFPTAKAMKKLTKFFMFWWEKIGTYDDREYKRSQYNYWEKSLNSFGLKYNETKEKDRRKNKVPFSHLVMPDYAATVHSFQGSSCENVVIDWQNLQSAVAMDTRLRLSYVAASRATNRLFICTSDDM